MEEKWIWSAKINFSTLFCIGNINLYLPFSEKGALKPVYCEYLEPKPKLIHLGKKELLQKRSKYFIETTFSAAELKLPIFPQSHIKLL